MTYEVKADCDNWGPVGWQSFFQWLGRQSLTGGLSMIYADLWLTCDHFFGKMFSMVIF